MATEREILRYELDITDAEAKAARLQELLAQMATKKAAGEDTTELEQRVNAEMDGLGKLAKAKEEDLGAGEKLLSQKEKLASVITVLGGSFGGTAGQLGGLVEMMLRGGAAAAGLAGAVAGLTLLVQAYRSIQEEARKAAEGQEKLNAAVLATKNNEITALAEIGVALRAERRYSAQNVAAAYAIEGGLQERYGVSASEARQAAVRAVVQGGAKVTVDDAARLAGFPSLDTADPAARQNVREGERKTPGLVQRTPEEEVFVRYEQQLGGMNIDQFRARLREVAEARQAMRKYEEDREKGLYDEPDLAAAMGYERRRALAAQWGIYEREVERERELQNGVSRAPNREVEVTPRTEPAVPSARDAERERINEIRARQAEQAGGQPVTYNHYEEHHHYGTVYNRPDPHRGPGNPGGQNLMAQRALV